MLLFLARGELLAELKCGLTALLLLLLLLLLGNTVSFVPFLLEAL